MSKSSLAQKEWRHSTLESRLALCDKFCTEMEAQTDQVAKEISTMMGKPFHHAQGEVSGCIERARQMMEFAPKVLADEMLPEKEGFMRKLVREPVGVVAVIAPWNYPLLTSVNCIIPAILSGNSIIIKHSSRTPLVADAFVNVFKKANAPENLVQALHTDHSTLANVLANPAIQYTHFTGSVRGGHEVYQTVAKSRFMDVGLELGGKDPAYVAEDADLDRAVEGAVDGGFFNAGQSCCGVERVYVHRSLYEEFLKKAAVLVAEYKLGDPFDPSTNMGPMAQPSSIPFLHEQVKEAEKMGARIICGGKPTTDANGKGRFFEPTIVADCTHEMSVIKEESFGPIIAVMPVDSDEEALALMNDSPYGLTASIWTSDAKRAEKMAPMLECGTVFMNRCDFLDPMLAWSGHKDTGKGISLSHYGFDPLTRIKSYHFKE